LDTHSLEAKEGDRVHHKAFGAGTVSTLTGGGNNQIIEILFDSGTKKKFAAAYATISVLKE